jgi:release factor glutamine methyltransferase
MSRIGLVGTVEALHEELTASLTAAGIQRPADEARDIIAAVMDVARFWPTLNPDAAVTPEQRTAARRAFGLRARGAPFAYAVGRTAFRTLTLAVDERVLIPRQETEELIDLVLALQLKGTALDVGTGSGAIALALAAEGSFDRVIATDISSDALTVAERNVDACLGMLRTRVELRHGWLLEPAQGERVELLVSNPPYIALTERDDLPNTVRDWEPPLALFSDEDGMTATRAIVAGAADVLASHGVLALEVDCRRAQLVAETVAATGAFRDVEVRLDLSGRERFVLARLDR